MMGLIKLNSLAYFQTFCLTYSVVDKMTSIKQAVGAKYLLFPKIQLKYAFIYSSIIFTAMSTMIAGQYYMLGQGEQYSLNQENLDMIRMSLLRLNLVVLSMSCLICFVLSILITHRFLGPTVSISRALDLYKKDKTFKKISIRKTDEVQDLVDTLNLFLKEVETKAEGASDEK